MLYLVGCLTTLRVDILFHFVAEPNRFHSFDAGIAVKYSADATKRDELTIGRRWDLFGCICGNPRSYGFGIEELEFRDIVSQRLFRACPDDCITSAT